MFVASVIFRLLVGEAQFLFELLAWYDMVQTQLSVYYVPKDYTVKYSRSFAYFGSTQLCSTSAKMKQPCGRIHTAT